ncbi:MAG TPA: type II secretion system F family protein [Planctomycetes bacterium]|nr:type II secretion system F family protein [Planctomycetota bacterium]
MAKFKVLAKDGAGRRVEETISASNRNDAMNEARRRGLSIIRMDEKKGGGLLSLDLGALLRGGRPPRPRVTNDDLVVFTRQFATMVSAGIAILECVEILAEQASDPGFRIHLQQVSEDVRGGLELSEALAKHPKIFSNLYVNMVKAGEAAGQLDEIFSRLAEYQEATQKLRREVVSAMTYPVISLAMIFGVSALLLLFIVPKFKEIFEQMGFGDKLPLPTKVVLGISDVLRNDALPVVGIIAVIAVIVWWWKKTEKGAYQWDWLMLKVPIYGPLVQKVALSRFSRTFSTLVRSGVAVLGALEIVAATSGNRVLEKAVEEAREAIRTGQPIAEPLSRSPVFPPMVVKMIAIGEHTGALEQLLEKISQFYDEQVSSTVESLTSLIEPIMIGVMGVVVGTMVLAVFLPILNMQKMLMK